MAELSERRRQIMEFITQYQREQGFPPTIREIGRATGITSTSVVDYHLRVLHNGGYLRRTPKLSRGLGPVEEPGRRRSRWDTPGIDIVGRIAAGEPIEAIPGHPDTLEIGEGGQWDNCYALQVKGQSMIEDCIDDGDYVVVKRQDTAENGSIVVALLEETVFPEGVVTLKRFFREEGRIRLQPRNPEMSPIYVDPDKVKIQGKVVAVVRHIPG